MDGIAFDTDFEMFGLWQENERKVMSIIMEEGIHGLWSMGNSFISVQYRVSLQN